MTPRPHVRLHVAARRLRDRRADSARCSGRSVRSCAASTRTGSGCSDVHGCHGIGRHSFPSQQRGLRPQVSARDDGVGRRGPRRRRRRVAGRVLRQRHPVSRAAGSRILSGAVPQQRQWHVHRHYPCGGTARRDVRHGRGGRGLRQRRPDRPVRDGTRREPAVPECGRLAVRRRHGAGRRRRLGVFDERRLV